MKNTPHFSSRQFVIRMQSEILAMLDPGLDLLAVNLALLLHWLIGLILVEYHGIWPGVDWDWTCTEFWFGQFSKYVLAASLELVGETWCLHTAQNWGSSELIGLEKNRKSSDKWKVFQQSLKKKAKTLLFRWLSGENTGLPSVYAVFVTTDM